MPDDGYQNLFAHLTCKKEPKAAGKLSTDDDLTPDLVERTALHLYETDFPETTWEQASDGVQARYTTRAIRLLRAIQFKPGARALVDA